jgi:hypothetical protein
VTMSEVVEVSDLLVKGQCFCLNQDSLHPFSNLFVGDETLYLQSDADGTNMTKPNIDFL